MVLGHEPRQTTSNLGHLNKPSIQVMPVFDYMLKVLYILKACYKWPVYDPILSLLICFATNFSCALKGDYENSFAKVRFVVCESACSDVFKLH